MQKLVANAVEARAKRIRVDVDMQSLHLKVQDDGCGISPHDMLHIGHKNKTNKVGSSLSAAKENPEYKGESLASLAQIAEVCITTKSAAYSQESFKRIKGGEVKELSHRLSTRGVQGTCVELRDIFFNLPVRKKQMLADKTWKSQLRYLLIQRMQRFVLLHPDVSVQLVEAGSRKSLLSFTACKSMEEAFYQTFGNDFDIRILKESPEGEFKVCGFVASTKTVAVSSRIQFVFVNERAVATPRLVKREIEALFSRAMRELECKRPSGNPVFVIHISCSPRLFDTVFNEAIPTVTFHDWTPLLDKIKTIVSEALGLTSQGDEISRVQVGALNIQQSRARKKQKLSVLKRRKFARAGRCDLGSSSSSRFRDTRVPKAAFRECHVISQMSNKFVIIKHENLLLCIDQHAMDERIRLESFQREIEEKEQLASIIGTAQVKLGIGLGDDEIQLLRDRSQYLIKWGWRWQGLDDSARSLIVYQAPTVFGVPLRTAHLRSFLYDATSSIPKSITNAIITRACRGAVKFGDRLSREQCITLVRKLSECANPFQCAHGRPSCVPLMYL